MSTWSCRFGPTIKGRGSVFGSAIVNHRRIPALPRPAVQRLQFARDAADLAELLLEFDQFFQLWSVNHLTMVQSMIGRKSGTGFLGPECLKETVSMGMQGEDDRLLRMPQIRPRLFENLREVRTRMQFEEP